MTPEEPRFSGRRAIALVLVTWTLTAGAATDIVESKQATLNVSVAHVLEVLESSDVCEKGCKYFAPKTVREVKVAPFAEKNSYYKWTHVTDVKTVKFFKHVKVVPGPVTTVCIRSLTADKDAKLIEQLVAKTKLEHSPAFDLSTADFTITPKGSQVEVRVKAMIRVSGLMSLFASAARSGLKESLDALFGSFMR